MTAQGPGGMHRSGSSLGVQNEDGEFEFVYHFNNHFNPFRFLLSLHVAKWKTWSFSDIFIFIIFSLSKYELGFCKETNEQRMKTFLSAQHATNRNKDSNDYQNGEWIQTHRRPFWRPKRHPNPMQIYLCVRVDLALDKNAVENQNWAAGPPGLRTAGPPGRGPAFRKSRAG